MTPANTRFGRTSLFSPPTAQSQNLFQPLNQFANDALLATQNLLVQSLANYNTLQTTQQVINGLFNSYRNTNTFKPGGPNVVAVAGPKNSIQTTQQVINGLFNSYRNTNTFKP